MSRRVARFTELDMRRAIIAAKALGPEAYVESRPDGALFIMCSGTTLHIEKEREAAAKTPRQGFVYFIRAGKSGAIKIGFSLNPQARLSALQTSQHHRLSLMAAIPGTMEDEGDLHVKFGHLRKSGEWFTGARELVDYIIGLYNDPRCRIFCR